MAFLRWNNSYRQHVLNLLGRSKDPCLLVGSAYDETIDLPVQYEVEDGYGIALVHILRRSPVICLVLMTKRFDSSMLRSHF
ncbi:MAG: hypothetical protein HC799_18600 [Limnothrix sp. RL_2_0]|nr:hypothetical protein [Limnothrix sp. RL_2_0]